MHPIIFQSRIATIYSWGLMVAIGYLAALAVSVYLSKKEDIAADHVMNLAIITAICAIIGARTFFVIQFFGEFSKRPVEIFIVQRGGLVFLGGLIAGLIGVIVYCRMNKLDGWKVLDLMSPGILLGYAIGRIGCFLNGCCYGIETKMPWGVVFPADACMRHPTQLYSAFAGALMFVILMFIYDRKRAGGQVFMAALGMYACYRFILEFFRYSPTHFIGLTPSQYVSVIVLAFAIFLWMKKNTTS